MKTTYKFQGIILELDTQDPDTPAMVWSGDRKCSSTVDCALATGELDGNDGPYYLSVAQSQWLEGSANEARIDATFKAARGHLPEYL